MARQSPCSTRLCRRPAANSRVLSSYGRQPTWPGFGCIKASARRGAISFHPSMAASRRDLRRWISRKLRARSSSCKPVSEVFSKTFSPFLHSFFSVRCFYYSRPRWIFRFCHFFVVSLLRVVRRKSAHLYSKLEIRVRPVEIDVPVYGDFDNCEMVKFTFSFAARDMILE